MTKKKQKVIVAISGGVDSSVTAMLLKKAGYEVTGVFMRLGLNNSNAENSARQVCQNLGIKFYPYNLAPDFKKEIINYFLESYERGITPNPCVKCNQFIKFGKLLQIARELGADYLATGHYVRRQIADSRRQNKKFKLLKAKDENKDQSYFLYTLTQAQLAKILFPMGDYVKDDVKKIAAKAGLPNLKTESQDVCFLPGDHNDFLKDKIKLKTGKIVLITSPQDLPPTPSFARRGGSGSLHLTKGEIKRGSRVVGEHKGLPLYTIGQRRGVEIGGSGPYYVVKCDYQKNILYVTRNHDDPFLYSNKFIAKNVNWVSGVKPKLPLKCEAVIRYRHKPQKCKIQESKIKNNYLIILKKPQRAITSGQSAVFYKGNEILGGGVIEI